jgi:hypothetical protein
MNFTRGIYRHIEKMKLYVGTSRLDIKACQSSYSHKTVGAVQHTSSLARNVQRPRQVLKKKTKKKEKGAALNFKKVNFSFPLCIDVKENRNHRQVLRKENSEIDRTIWTQNFSFQLSNFCTMSHMYNKICLDDQQILKKAEANHRGSELVYDLSTS